MIPLLLVLLACGGPDSGAPALAPAHVGADPCASAPTWEGETAGLLLSHCSGCHAAASPDRHGAPAADVFDTEAQAQAAAARIRARVLDTQDMPPAGGLLPAERDALGAWLDCLE